MCLYPQLIQNRKYTSNKKNGGVIPPIYDNRTRYVAIGCQQCIECRKQKARAWQVRLLEDIKTNTNGKFITLTFSNESIKNLNKEIPRIKKIQRYNQPIKIILLTGYERDNAMATLATRRFLERYRKKYKKSLRHWLVTEIGHKGTENIHMHGIIWTDEPLTIIEEIWGYGYMWKGYKKNEKYINYVNGKTVTYISKYINKIDQQHKTFKGKILTSAGIGNNYINTHASRKNQYNEINTDELYRTSTGHKMAMPIYFRNKIYTDEEKEQLWIQKLDKQERYICGEKIDISKTEENYYKLLQYHKTRNKELGYGNNEKNWKRSKYEEERRKIMQNERIKQGMNPPPPHKDLLRK